MSIDNTNELEIIKKLAGISSNTQSLLHESKKEKTELEEEWANSTEYFDGEERELEQPKGEIVDTSLRRYLGAKGDHTVVDEIKEHTVQDMMESYKKFKGDEQLDEHENYQSYVEPLKSKGYDIEVSEVDDDGLVFHVEKDGKKITVNEPKSGVYQISGESKSFSSLEDAINSKLNTVNESSIRQLKKNAGLLTEQKNTNTENVIDLTELKRKAGIL